MKKSVIITLIIVVTIVSFLCYQKYNLKKEIYESDTIKQNNKMLSMMFETSYDSGIYEEQTTSNWPTSGYKFNEELSNCENGSELSWDDINKKVIVHSRVSDRCYIYFDLDIIISNQIHYEYTNKTECTTVKCALDELYEIIGG